MHRRRHLSSLVLAAVVACQALLGGPVTAWAEDDEGAGGVEGYSYTSPSFGYALTWPAVWEVEGESSADGDDVLHLATGGGTLAIVGTRDYGADAAACVDGFVAEVAAAEGIDALAPMDDGPSRPIAGGVGVVFAVYSGTTAVPASQGDGTGVSDARVAAAATVYVECRPLAAGTSLLAVAIAAPADAYGAVAEAARPLLRRLQLGGAGGDQGSSAEGTATGQGGDPGQPDPSLAAMLPAESFKDYALRIASDLDGYWQREFFRDERYYIEPEYRVFDDTVNTACGPAETGMGPFYCRLSQAIFLDQPWMEANVLWPYGGVAVAMVLAHEAAHHVQLQLGYAGTNISVQHELEADCLAGVYLGDAIEDGELTLPEVEAIVPFVESLGDPNAASSYDPSAHGLGAQRGLLFLRGVHEGEDACSV